MNTFDLELPDGTVLAGIPEGTTKEQIRSKLASQGIDPEEMQQEADIKQYEDQGGGFMSSLEKGGRRFAQSLAAMGVSGADNNLEIKRNLLAQAEPGSHAARLFQDEIDMLERSKVSGLDALTYQQGKLDELPTHPTISRMGESANEQDGVVDAVTAAAEVFLSSPDKLGVVRDLLGEQGTNIATTILLTRGIGGTAGLAERAAMRKAMEAAAVGAGAGGGSFLSTYGPNVAQYLNEGLSYDEALEKAGTRSATQSFVDAATATIAPFKIGGREIINIPTQAGVQAVGGGGGEYLAARSVGEDPNMGDVALEGMLELVTLPGDIAAAATIRDRQKDKLRGWLPGKKQPAPDAAPAQEQQAQEDIPLADFLGVKPTEKPASPSPIQPAELEQIINEPDTDIIDVLAEKDGFQLIEEVDQDGMSTGEKIWYNPDTETFRAYDPTTNGFADDITLDEVADGTLESQGTQDAPVAVQTPVDVAVAEQQVNTQPTEAQKEAGNYKKGHVKIKGLDITIENPKGSERSGVDGDGNPWSVQMPSAYGYIKRTTGADGEQVDVYVGDNPDSDRVFIVDQIEPDTAKFDEHKVMIGFNSPEEVAQAYGKAFSDGSAGTRMGGVEEYSIDEFKQWLKGEDTTKPSSEMTGEMATAAKQEKESIRARLSDYSEDHLRTIASKIGLKVGPKDSQRQMVNKLSGWAPSDLVPTLDSFDEALGEFEKTITTDSGKRFKVTKAEIVPTRAGVEARPIKVEDEGAAQIPQGLEKTFKMLDDAIQQKNRAVLREVLRNTDNKQSRARFESATGIKLPKTVSGTLEAVEKFVTEQKQQGRKIWPVRQLVPGDHPIIGVKNRLSQYLNSLSNEEYNFLEESAATPPKVVATYSDTADRADRLIEEWKTTLGGNAPTDAIVKGMEEMGLGTLPKVEVEAKPSATKPAQKHPQITLETSDTDLEKIYPKAGASVSGLTVREDVPNTDSISASIDNYETLPGIREIPFSWFSGPDKPTDRTRKLAAEINESGEINPLIVVIDKDGPYILEGGHRYDALQQIGKETFPAVVVLDIDSLPDTASDSASLNQNEETPSQQTDDAADEQAALARAMAIEIGLGKGYKTVAQYRTDLNKMAGGKEVVQAGDKRLDELVEQSYTQAAYAIASQSNVGTQGSTVKRTTDPAEVYDRLVQLHDRQPSLTVRTSESREMQAYSTPAPIAYVASRLAGLHEAGQGDVIYEPTAGHGILLLDAARRAQKVMNELMPSRFEYLKGYSDQNTTVLNMDAAKNVPNKGAIDYIISNPPFATVLDDSGKTIQFKTDLMETSQIDQAIMLNTLAGMKDDGRAVFIIGSKGGVRNPTTEQIRQKYNALNARKFFKTLYDNYNVVDHFTISGDLYKKQGAAYPIDIIVINGKGRSALDLPGATPPRILRNFKELRGLLTDDQYQDRIFTQQPSGAAPVSSGDSQPGAQRVTEERVSEPVRAGADEQDRASDQRVREEGSRDDDRIDVPERGVSGSAGVGERTAVPRVPAERRASEAGTVGERAADDESGADSRPARAGRPERPAGDVAADTRSDARRTESRALAKKAAAEGTLQVSYKPHSKARSLDTLIPSRMLTAVDSAIETLEKKHGSIDTYVKDKLGYGSMDELYDHLGAEQIEAVGLAIANMEKGAGFIIGDQTGVGKGRVVASVLRYAKRVGKVPVFITERPGLYGDMYRDLAAVGESGFQALVTNNDIRGDKAIYVSETGDTIKSLTPKDYDAAERHMMAEGTLPEGYDFLFTTYSQLQTVQGKSTDRQKLIDRMAKGAIIVLDESHNAGGQQGGWNKKSTAPEQYLNRANLVRHLVRRSAGVLYSSATYAKNPEVMDLYQATDISKAVKNLSDLPAVINSGGVPLQQVIANMLVEAGQYLRRERSYDGISMEMMEVDVSLDKADQVSAAINEIYEFDVLMSALKANMDKELAKAGEAAGFDNAVGEAGITSANFTSKLHNLMGQVLTALKTESTIERAVSLHKAGEKPVIAISNTNESFLDDYISENELTRGDEIEGLTFGDIMVTYLERTREYLVKDSDKVTTRHRLSDAELGEETLDLFKRIKERIKTGKYRSTFTSLPVSPIDAMKAGMEKAGMKVGELTGRTSVIDYDGDKMFLGRRASNDAMKKRDIDAFNSGEIDALIVNKSGATGFSFHASETFKDQTPRHMLILQADANIDVFMQMLGRINRTGQVAKPRYSIIVSSLPSEKRPAAILMRKLASLNANTTANKESAVSLKNVTDFMNKYGDEVVADLLKEEPDVMQRLDLVNDAAAVSDGLARKATGRLVVLPVKEQARYLKMIEDNYREKIEYLDKIGENTLEAKELDLRAEELSAVTISDKKAGTSPFEQEATLKKMKVRMLGKPYRWAEVQELVTEALGGKPAGDHASAIVGEYIKDTTPRIEEDQKLREEIIRKNGKETALNAADKRIKQAKQHQEAVEKFFKRWNVGSRGVLKSDDGNRHVVITGIERVKSQSPVSLSQFKVRFAVGDATRDLKLPLSQLLSKPGTNISPRFELENSYLSEQGLVDMFDKQQHDRFEERYIVTGNLLSGFDTFKEQKGRIAFFTTAAGDIEQGIIMPRTFKGAEAVNNMAMPIKDAAEGMEFLKKASEENGIGTLTADSGALTIQRNRYGEYVIDTKGPGSRRYWVDKVARKHVGEFVGKQTVSNMKAKTTDADGVKKLIAHYTKQYGLTFEVTSNQNVLRGMRGVAEVDAAFMRPAAAKPQADRAGDWLSSIKVRPVEKWTKESKEFVRQMNRIALQTFGAPLNVRYAEHIRENGSAVDGFYLKGVYGGAAEYFAVISLEKGDTTPRFRLNHEGIHFLKRIGALDDAWAALVNEAQHKWMKQYDIRKKYPDLTYDQQLEEAIANGYAEWASGLLQQEGVIAKAFDKIKLFLRRITAALNGRGYSKVNDVFTEIASGSRVQPDSSGTIHADPDQQHYAFQRRAKDEPEPLSFAYPDLGIYDIIFDRDRSVWERIGRLRKWEPIERLRIAIQDRMLPLARVQRALEESTGKLLSEQQDVYLTEELYSGRTGYRLDRLNADHIEPLMDMVSDFLKANDKDMEYIERYLYAKHAPERNKRIAEINEKFPDGGSGMTTLEAETIIEDAKRAGHDKELETIYRQVRTMLDEALKYRLEMGLLSKKQYDSLKKTYKDYIPLRGLAEIETDGASAERMKIGKKYNIRGPESKAAFGRKSRASNILAHVTSIAEEAIIRGEKNRVYNSFYKMVQAHPNPDVWEVRKVVLRPVLSKETGLVEYRPVAAGQYGDDGKTLWGKVNGKPTRVTIHNPKLAQAMRGIGSQSMPTLIGYMQQYMRYLSSTHTGWNPDFIVSNAFRDLQTAGINLLQYDVKNLERNTIRDYPLAMIAAYNGLKMRDATGGASKHLARALEKSGLKGSEEKMNEWVKYYHEFAATGGKVAFFKPESIEDRVKSIQHELFLRSGGMKAATWNGGKSLFKFVEDANLAIENALRLSAYVNARRAGVPKQKAAQIAKNLTVNFNKRGEYTSYLNAAYLFFNAGLQGWVVVMQAMKNRKVQKAVMAIAGLAIAESLANAAISPEDDDGELLYDKIPLWEKEGHLIMMLPGGADLPDAVKAMVPYGTVEGVEYIKIPLAYGYRVFHEVGRNAADVMRGATSPLEAALNSATSALNNSNPMGSSANLLHFLSPTWTDPLVEIADNRNYFDSPIVPERNPFDMSPPPRAYNHFYDATLTSKGIAQALNNITGGNEFKAGAINIYPDALDYVFAQYVTGSAGAFFGRLGNAVDAVYRGEEIPVRNIPIARKVLGSTSDFYDRHNAVLRMAEIEAAVDEVKNFNAIGNAEKVKQLRDDNGWLLYLYDDAKLLQKQRKAVREARGQIYANEKLGAREQTDQLQALRAREKILIDNFNREYIKAAGKTAGDTRYPFIRVQNSED